MRSPEAMVAIQAGGGGAESCSHASKQVFASHPMGKKPKAAAVSPSKVPLPPSFTAIPAPKKTQPLSHSEDEDEESDDGSDDETDGIDEKGMKRLMELLGDDALDDFTAAQLDALKRENDVSEESSGSDDGDELGSEAEDRNGEHVSEDEELGESDSVSSNDDSDGNDAEEEMKDEKMASPVDEAEDEEEIALDGHDDISIDEDAVPKQKVVIDNKVRCHSPLDGGVIDIVTPSRLRCVVYVKR
jgi:rRNA-processing protein EBP2